MYIYIYLFVYMHIHDIYKPDNNNKFDMDLFGCCELLTKILLFSSTGAAMKQFLVNAMNVIQLSMFAAVLLSGKYKHNEIN